MDNATSIRRILRLDALTCLAMGALLILAGGNITALTGLPLVLVRGAGIALVPIALFMAATAIWWATNGLPVWLIILGNACWVAASLYVVTSVASITGFGVVFVLAQAVVVSAITVAEWRSISAFRSSAAVV